MTAPESIADDMLRSGYRRWLDIEERKEELAGESRDLFAELKADGFDTKALRGSFRIRRNVNDAATQEHDALVDIYVAALMRDPQVRAREIIEEFDAETGEILEHGSHAKASVGNADNLAVRDSQETDGTAVDHVGSGDASRLSGGSGTAVSIPPPPETVGLPEASASGDNSPETALCSGGAEAARQVHTLEVAGASPAPATNPVANVGEGADGADAVAPIDPASREADDGDRQLVAASGFTGDRVPGSGEPVPAGQDRAAIHADPADKPGEVTASPALPAPGVVYMERCPPEPIVYHDFARCWPEMYGLNLLGLINRIEANGVEKPIVKIGNFILDGRARYNAARQLIADGKLEAYPVVQYAGDDPLADSIRWNLTSGRMMTMAERKTIATKLSKLPGNEHRASEIAEMFSLEMAVPA